MVGCVERGMRNPTLETVLRMAEAMNVDFEDIIKRARRELSKSAKQAAAVQLANCQRRPARTAGTGRSGVANANAFGRCSAFNGWTIAVALRRTNGFRCLAVLCFAER